VSWRAVTEERAYNAPPFLFPRYAHAYAADVRTATVCVKTYDDKEARRASGVVFFRALMSRVAGMDMRDIAARVAHMAA